jgi:hypothetical protein
MTLEIQVLAGDRHRHVTSKGIDPEVRIKVLSAALLMELMEAT